jgi:hypothetical protein
VEHGNPRQQPADVPRRLALHHQRAAASQLDLCQRFATLKGDRFAGVDYRLSATGLPILPTRWPGSNATTAAAMTKATT